MPDDVAELRGTLRAWERPEGMTVEEFMALPCDELRERLGEPVAQAENIVVNNLFYDVLGLMTGAGATSIAVAALAVGNGALGGGPARTDSSLVGELKRYLTMSTSLSATDPISAVFSFFMPAADGAMTLTEAGMFHAGSTTAVGTGRMTTHVAFAYSKGATTDTRVDYTLTRSLT